MVVFNAVSKSQSSKIIVGFLPPNSNDNFLNIGAAVRAMCSPVAVPPVKEIALILGCLTIASPILAPVPFSIVNAPGGNPASMAISPNIVAV